MNRMFQAFIAFTLIFMSGCEGCSKNGEKNEKEYPINIVVLLDISDRISLKKYKSFAVNTIKKDKENYQFIIDKFDNMLDNPVKGYADLEDKLQFVVLNQPRFRFRREYNNEDLVFNNRTVKNYEHFDDREREILKTLSDLYSEADDYDDYILTGSDIWEWFKESANSYIRPEYRNYVIFLTDGYLDFSKRIRREPGTFMKLDKKIRTSDNWEEMLETEEYKLKTPDGIHFGRYKHKVQFLILGLKDRTEELEELEELEKLESGKKLELDEAKPTDPKTTRIPDKDILRGMWTIWLKSMGIDIKRDDFVSDDVNQQEQILRFLSPAINTEKVE